TACYVFSTSITTIPLVFTTPRIPFPPLPPILSPPLPVLSPAPPPSPIRSLGYRAAMIQLRAKATSTSSPSLQPPFASCREDRPEVTLPPQKKLGIDLGLGYEVGESSSAAAARPAGGLRADYGFVATMDKEIMRDPEREREFETRVRQDTDEIFMRLDDEQTEQQLSAGRLNMLFRDRHAHVYTRHLMETEARISREAWVQSTYVSDLVRGEEIYRDYRVEDNPTGTGDSFARIGFRITGTAGTRWRSTADQETINATSVTSAQLQAMIDQGVTAALAARDALRSTNGDDSHNSGTGLPDMIHGSVVASRPKTMQEAIEIATKLMDKKIRTFAERKTASKRKFENTSRNTQNQQQQSNKRQNIGQVYTAASGEKKQYGGSKPLCAKCNYHHDGPSAPKCNNCN
nr:hypothetical protein [Tanacetum cinerariifolium]